MQIIGGSYKGRKLAIPLDDPNLRPTKAIVKQAAVNMLLSRINLHEVMATDICCGIGSLGLELVSRGIKHVTFIDKNTKWVKQNIATLDAGETSTVIQSDALKFTPSAPFDIILSDPPYGLDMPTQLLTRKDTLGKTGSLWLIEAETGYTPSYNDADFELLKQKRFGKSTLWLFLQL